MSRESDPHPLDVVNEQIYQDKYLTVSMIKLPNESDLDAIIRLNNE